MGLLEDFIIINITALIVVFLAYLIVMWVKVYNKFVAYKVELEERIATVKTLIKQRAVMLGELSGAVIDYANHEHITFKDTITARKGFSNVGTNAIETLSKPFINVNAVLEDYPNIKANDIYQSYLGKDSIEKIESRFRSAVNNYNLAVRFYNKLLQKFPTNIVGRAHGFERKTYYTFDIKYEQI